MSVTSTDDFYNPSPGFLTADDGNHIETFRDEVETMMLHVDQSIKSVKKETDDQIS